MNIRRLVSSLLLNCVYFSSFCILNQIEWSVFLGFFAVFCHEWLMIIRRSTDGWSPPPPPSSDELTFRGPKHPIMLLGRFCPNYFLSNHYYYILCFCSLAYYALYGIVDLVIICRFISLFCPDLFKYVFSLVLFCSLSGVMETNRWLMVFIFC